MENQDTKIFWDFNIGTDCVIAAKHPDVALIDKSKETFIIDVAIPFRFFYQELGGWKANRMP